MYVKIFLVIFMKIYHIIEAILQVIAFIVILLVLVFNQNKINLEYFNYKIVLIYFGYVIPVIHIIMILIKQLSVKRYLGSKYDSIMSYFIVLVSGFIHILLIYNIDSNTFNKIHILFWLLIPLIYIVFILCGILLEKRDIKKNKNLKIRANN